MNKIMNMVSNSFFLLLFLISFVYLPNLRAEASFEKGKNYFIDYGFNKIPAEYVGQNERKKLLVIGREVDEQIGESIVLQLPTKDGKGRAYFPIADKRFRVIFIEPEEHKNAMTALENGQLMEALAIMRPYVYPLFRYVDIPQDAFNVHSYIAQYIKTLIQAEQWWEAFNILGRFSFEKVDPWYLASALDVSIKFIENGQAKEAAQLFDKIPVKETNLDQQNLIMQFASALRDNESFPQAYYVYRQLASVPDFEYIEECRLWQAYCNIRLGKPNLARVFIDSLGNYDRQNREFSLYQLIIARLALLEENNTMAIEAVSEGVVYSRLGHAWVPELLYTTALCYEALGEPAVAKSIYQQGILFFEDSIWGKRSQERLSTL